MNTLIDNNNLSANPDVILTTEKLASLIKSNISCHMNKPLTQQLIDELSFQIVESIDYFLNRKVEDN